LNFLSVKGPELISMYVGESEKNVRDIFKKVSKHAQPCNLHITCMDALNFIFFIFNTRLDLLVHVLFSLMNLIPSLLLEGPLQILVVLWIELSPRYN
jgi:hypothetical protein